MKKKTILVVLLFFVSVPISFAYDYWYQDLNISGTTRRVYFFKDFSSFEDATGMEIGSLLNWVQLNDRFTPQHTKTIFESFDSQGFVAAFFAFDPWHDPNYGRTMYEYTFYIRSGGRYGTKYTKMPYLRTRINFPY